MPIYEYVCKACGAESELMQRLSDPPARQCPVCHRKKLVKNISAAGFRLSGGGWYETDFKSGNKKNVAGDKAEPKAEGAPAAKSEGASAAKAEGKSEGKSDRVAAKPADKPSGGGKAPPKKKPESAAAT